MTTTGSRSDDVTPFEDTWIDTSLPLAWVRATQLSLSVSLFGVDGPTPLDVCDGPGSNGAILSALAGLAAVDPGSIRGMFAAPFVSSDGKYEVRIWTGGQDRRVVTIDDRLPVRSGIFYDEADSVIYQGEASTKVLPVGSRQLRVPYGACSARRACMWAGLAEKALAKLLGGYAALRDLRPDEVLLNLNPKS